MRAEARGVDLTGDQRRVRQEPRDERAPRAGDQRIGRADLLDPAGVEHRDAVCQSERFGTVVRDVHDRQSELARECVQFEPQMVSQRLVERRQRFVQEQHSRSGDERPRERHALPLAARQRCRVPTRTAVEPDQLER